MARQLALEWNEEEARVVVASLRGDRVALEHAFSVDLKRDDSEGEVSEFELGKQIAAALAKRRLGRIDTLAVVGRADVELRQLSLPPAPDDELADMVRFQADREFTVLADDWPLDYLPLDNDPEAPRSVLAAAVSPKLVAGVEKTCQAAGQKPHRLLLRPCAAASLLGRQRPASSGEARLLVELLAEEVDLTVVVDQKPVFLRRARLPGDPLAEPEASEALLNEIRRTRVAVQNQLGGRRVESIVLCGARSEHERLAESLCEHLPIQGEVLDPFEGLLLEGDLRRALPKHRGRFAPLLGMLCDELEEVPHAFDFLNPRRRPEPPSHRNTVALAGLVAACLVLLGIVYGWYTTNRLEASVNKLTRQSVKLDKQTATVDEFEQVAEEIERWVYPEIVWLDELHRLSANFPAPEQAMLTELRMGPHREGGEIKMDVRAANIGAIDQLAERITALEILPPKNEKDTKHNTESKTKDQSADENEEGDGEQNGESSQKEDADTAVASEAESGASDEDSIPHDPARKVITRDTRADTSREPYRLRVSASLVIERERPY